MDMSPLPHKAPCFVATYIEPTPQTTPVEEDKPIMMETMRGSLMEGIQQPAPQT